MVEKLKTWIDTHKTSSGVELLDVACGTGGHVPFLREQYGVTGLDLSGEMLEIARGKCPGIPFIQGNMVDLDLGQRFDVITCMFSAIGYLLSVEDLNITIQYFSRHLRSGGVDSR